MESNVSQKSGDVWDFASPEVPVVHCVSADFALGAGFAHEVSDRFPAIRRTLQNEHADTPLDERVGRTYRYEDPGGQVVYNLVTKARYYMRADRDPQPNFGTLGLALRDLCEQASEAGYDHLVMPRIGSGLDRLSWERTETLLKQIFSSGECPDVVVCWR